MPKTRTARPSRANVTASHSSDQTRHIPTDESDAVNSELRMLFREESANSDIDPSLDLAFAARVAELLGKETRVSFAKACKFSEGALRKYLKGYHPGRDNLVAMADYRNVSVEWLATGIPPKEKRKKELIYATAGAGKTNAMAEFYANQGLLPKHHDGQINTDLLRICLLTCKQVFGEDFSHALITIQMQYAADFYNQLVQMANTKGPQASIADFCSLEIAALAEQLRFFIKMGWQRNFPADDADRPRPGPDVGSWS